MHTQIYTDNEIEHIDLTKIADLVKATDFKASHIKAKAQPMLFEEISKALKVFEQVSRSMIPYSLHKLYKRYNSNGDFTGYIYVFGKEKIGLGYTSNVKYFEPDGSETIMLNPVEYTIMSSLNTQQISEADYIALCIDEKFKKSDLSKFMGNPERDFEHYAYLEHECKYNDRQER